MSQIVFVNDIYYTDFSSIFFKLFLNDFTSQVPVSSSFKDIASAHLPIFTSLNKSIRKLIDELPSRKYGLIVDGSENYSSILEYITNAHFVIVLGEVDWEHNFNNVTIVKGISPIGIDKDASIALTELISLPAIYEEFLDGKYSYDDLHVLYTKHSQFIPQYHKLFAEIGVNIHFYKPTPLLYEKLISSASHIIQPESNELRKELHVRNNSNEAGQNKEFITLKELADMVTEKSSSAATFVEKSNFFNTSPIASPRIINIICYNPTYLFKDLVDRFVQAGCIHSEYPLENAASYIWMRPQELWHYEYLLSNRDHVEISKTYRNEFSKLTSPPNDMLKIKSKSIAIHHGTCHEPLYQFCSTTLANALVGVKKVVGVCEFEECYGPSAKLANKNNFTFIPIGYDHLVFSKEFWRTDTLQKKQKLKLGFVGRAYGTEDKALLARSRLAEPKGYRKGGDILLDIALHLKAGNIPFELHILGQNWEFLVEQFKVYGIDYVYYTRDTNITYQDYPKVYASMDALIITARCEGGPVSAIEALSLGVKVISTDVGVIPYLNQRLISVEGVDIFDYNRKWLIADTRKAVSHIKKLYEEGFSAHARKKIRDSIGEFTTESWVNKIYEYGLE